MFHSHYSSSPSLHHLPFSLSSPVCPVSSLSSKSQQQKARSPEKMVELQPIYSSSSNINNDNNKNSKKSHQPSSPSSSSSSSSPPLPSPTSPLPPSLPITTTTTTTYPPLLPHHHLPPPQPPQYPPSNHHHLFIPAIPYQYFSPPCFIFVPPDFNFPYPPPQPQPPLVCVPPPHIAAVNNTAFGGGNPGGVFWRRAEGGDGGCGWKRDKFKFKKLWKNESGGNDGEKVSGSRSFAPPPPPPPPSPPLSPVARVVEEQDLSNCTTVMIRNIPNMISRSTLVNMLDSHCRKQNIKTRSRLSEYDFIYLPFDFVRKMNMGYAFVNFTRGEGAAALNTWWTGKGWPDSSKIRLITRARLQGIDQCKKHFKDSLFLCHSDQYLPVEFCPPRNGWNGKTCKMINVGRWEHETKAKRIEKIWCAKPINIPPRLTH